MKKLFILLACVASFSAMSKQETKLHVSNYGFTQGSVDVLDLKLKLIDLLYLRGWEQTEQTKNSLSVQLSKCQVKLEINNDNVAVSYPQIITSRYSSNTRKPKQPCGRNWMHNIEKDVDVALRTAVSKQQAILLSKQ
ncbi:hypothetical protein [Vibrio gallicus]|uniref:hypothetical protein n=1 Tax=Vibrio gallicus TaxID=190897 RepID=UPI0021C3D8EC|nr:hypothetical protein [Vibrio gallicus]